MRRFPIRRPVLGDAPPNVEPATYEILNDPIKREQWLNHLRAQLVRPLRVVPEDDGDEAAYGSPRRVTCPP
jgi:hypothetical protein